MPKSHSFHEIAHRYGCPSVNLLYIFRTPLPKNTSGGLLLIFANITDASILVQELCYTFVCILL